MKKIITLVILLITVILTSNAQTDCNPATITNVAHEGTGNRIIWTMPTSGEEIVISQGGDFSNVSIGNYQNSLGVYHRFVPEDLATINGGKLNQIVFAPTFRPSQNKPGHIYTIQIYKGGKWGEVEERNPGTLLLSQELDNNNLLFNEENTITLEIPVTIEVSQELWIGYYCTNIDSIQSEMKYPVGIDAGPHKEGFGNIIFFQNQWKTFYELSSSTYNFFIKGIVQTVDGESVNIYCNDINIADNISGTTYFHSNPTGEENCYKVEVNCLEGVSILSNKVCIEGVGIKDNEPLGKFTVYPNPAKNELRVTSYELQDGFIEIYDVYGKKLISHTSYLTPHTSVDISGLSAGVYFIRIIDESGVSVQRFIKK